MQNNYIKIPRNFTEYPFFKNPKTLQIAMYLLLNAGGDGTLSVNADSVFVLFGMTEGEFSSCLYELNYHDFLTIEIRPESIIVFIEDWEKYLTEETKLERKAF